MIKFRTMVDGADKQVASLLDVNDSVGGVLFKIRDDPRVTASAGSCGSTASTSCPSSSTCCAAT